MGFVKNTKYIKQNVLNVNIIKYVFYCTNITIPISVTQIAIKYKSLFKMILH